MSGWRTALRMARREARRARGRSALVVAMIALPVAALTFAAVTDKTFTLTGAERADRLMGQAQAVVAWPQDGPVRQVPDYLGYFPAPDTARPAGQAPARSEAETRRRLLAMLPAGSAAIPDRRGHLTVRTAAGTGTVDARMLDYADPLAAGIFRPRSGRPPATGDEVALTAAAARRIGAGLGDRVRLAGRGYTFRVVAIVEDPDHLDAATIVLHLGALPVSALSGGARPDPMDSRWLVATPGPLTWDEVKRLNTDGVVAVSRNVLVHPPSQAEQYPESGRTERGSAFGTAVLVGGMAMLEIVLLAGPAFAVGARRRRRDLALVAASGGTPAQLRRIVLADGVVLGAVAAAAGIALGIAVVAAGRPLIEAHLANSRAGGFRVFPAALVALAGLAVVTGMLAALVPAWVTSRQDVVAALTGRRGITRSRRRWLVLGAALVVAGAGVTALGAWRVDATVIIAGLAIAELGLVLCTPALVGLVARVGRWLPLAPRIALRDTSRNRTAAAPAISAVMAAVIGSLAVGVLIAANDQRARDAYRSASRVGDVILFGGKGPGNDRPVPPDAIAALRSTLPVTQVQQIRTTSCDNTRCDAELRPPSELACPYSSEVLGRRPTPAEQRAARREPRCAGFRDSYRYFGLFESDHGMTVVVDDDAAGAVAGLGAADADRAATALRAGKVVVSDARYLQDGRVTLTITTMGVSERGAPRDTRTETAPGFALPHGPRAPLAMMTEPTARTVGLSATPFVTLATTSRLPTVAEQDRLQAALGDDLWVYVERGAPRPDTRALVVLAIVAGVITLGAAAIATGLAAADGRADLSTLAAVGASPRVRRALSLSQSGVIAGLGSILGAAAGLGASTAVLFALNRRYAGIWPAPTPYPITVPWLNLGAALVVVPLVAMLGAGLLTRSRLPIERRL